MSFSKLIIIGFLTFFLSLVFPVTSVFALDIKIPKIKPIPSIAKIVSVEHIFSDSNFSQATHNFNPGQTVYIKVNTTSTGDQQKILRFLDSNKNEIAQYIFNRSGDGEYIYTISFNVPNISGIYYVDIKIQSESNNVAIQENINVSGDVKGETVQSVAPSFSPNSTHNPSPSCPSISPESSVSASPSPSNLPNSPSLFANIFTLINNFFISLAQKLFKH